MQPPRARLPGQLRARSRGLHDRNRVSACTCVSLAEATKNCVQGWPSRNKAISKRTELHQLLEVVRECLFASRASALLTVCGPQVPHLHSKRVAFERSSFCALRRREQRAR